MALGKIKADTLEHSTAGSLDTSYVVNGSLKYWGFINQVTGTIEDTLNIASELDNGTGDTTITLSSAMTSGFHSSNVSSQPVVSPYERPKLFGSNTSTTQRFQNERTDNGVDVDTTDLCIQGAGDLA
jgi:hypothetical protein